MKPNTRAPVELKSPLWHRSTWAATNTGHESPISTGADATIAAGLTPSTKSITAPAAGEPISTPCPPCASITCRPCLTDGARLVVLAGLPGAGKSTYARRLPGVHLSTAAYRARRAGWWADLAMMPARVHSLLAAGRLVVVDALDCSAQARTAWLAIAQRLGVPAELHLVATDPDVALMRDGHRRHPAGHDAHERAASELAADAGAIASEGWARVRWISGGE